MNFPWLISSRGAAVSGGSALPTFNSEIFRGTPTYDGPSSTDVHTLSTGISAGKFAIAIASGQNAGTTITGITDSKGNTWKLDYSAGYFAYLSAPITTALIAGDTITVTYAAAFTGWRKCISILETSNVTGFDTYAGASYTYGSSKYVSMETSGAALVFGGVTNNSSYESIVASNDGTPISPWLGYSSNAWLGLLYKQLSAAGTATLGSAFTSSQWAQAEIVAYRGGPSYLIYENFEGTGTPAGWTITGSPNFAYTPAIVGAQSLRIYSASNGVVVSESPAFTGQSDVWLFGRFRINALNTTSGDSQFQLRGAANCLAGIYVQSNGDVKFKVDGSDSAASATTLSTSTNYYVWIHYVANGTSTLYVSSSSTRPTSDGSGNVVLTKTSGSVNATTAYCYNGYYAGDFVFDRIIVSSSEIGNNP
jgi:hypothetical protein